MKSEFSYKGLKRVFMASIYSISGIKYALKNEAAFRQELILFFIACVALPFLDLSNLETAILVLSAGLVLIVELINSAVEACIDRIGTEHNELSGIAKDLGSAAVFASLAFAIVTWFIVLS